MSSKRTEVMLAGNSQTTLLTLEAKHVDHAFNAKPVLGDRWATVVVEQLDYDFGKSGVIAPMSAGVVMRTRILDEWTAAFIDDHLTDGVTVLHLGCGLDARSLRLLHDKYEGDSKIRWVDVDVEDVANLRRRVLPDPKGDYTLLGVDVSDEGWLDTIPNDRPTVVVFEGLIMYLARDQGEDLLRRLVQRFPSGQLVFDIVSSFLVRVQPWIHALRRTGALLRWGISEPKELELTSDKLKWKDERFSCDEDIQDFPWQGRWIFYACRWLPFLRYSARNLRYTF